MGVVHAAICHNYLFNCIQTCICNHLDDVGIFPSPDRCPRLPTGGWPLDKQINLRNPARHSCTLTELADCAPLNAVSVLANGDVVQVGKFVESVFPEGGGNFVD